MNNASRKMFSVTWVLFSFSSYFKDLHIGSLKNIHMEYVYVKILRPKKKKTIRITINIDMFLT